jgi:hypothetical protein
MRVSGSTMELVRPTTYSGLCSINTKEYKKYTEKNMTSTVPRMYAHIELSDHACQLTNCDDIGQVVTKMSSILADQ